MSTEQLAIPLTLRDDATFYSFYPGKNQHIYFALRQIVKGQGEKFLYLWGEHGVGKTHLMQAACQQSRELNKASVYIPLRDYQALDTRIFEGLENISLICIDDVHLINKNSVWEEALFHLYNRLKLSNGYLLISALSSPLALPIQLADLKSRLAWGITYQIQPLSDDEKMMALILRASQRGLKLSKVVAKFLLNHCPRNMQDLFLTLEILDKAALIEKHPLTIPFVKQVLQL